VGENRFSGAASGFGGLELQSLDICRGGDPTKCNWGQRNIETAVGPERGFHERDR
jgi:hypothetical protein